MKRWRARWDAGAEGVGAADEAFALGVLLDQAAGIVTDLATMREIAAGPEQTAQVKP